MNLSKTKAIWIGLNKFSKDGICCDSELNWVHKVIALGITYTFWDLANIKVLNFTTFWGGKTAQNQKIYS